MNRIKLLGMAVVFGAFALTGCNEDNEAPTISDLKIDGETFPGETVTITATISDPEGDIKSVEVLEAVGAATVGDQVFIASDITDASYSLSYDYTISSTASKDDQINITVKVIDNAKKEENVNTIEDSETITVTLKDTPLATEVTGAFFHVGGSLKGSYDLMNDSALAASASSANKDMINTDIAGNAFTGSWSAGNPTMFVKDNAFDYANATKEAAKTSYDAGTGAASVTGPVVGDIYVAKLRGGLDYAVVKITLNDAADNSCNCGNTGKLMFDYKKM